MATSTPHVVVFSKEDPDDPKNWTRGRKRGVVALLCIFAFCSAVGSSLYATAEVLIRQKYLVNAYVASSGLTVYVLGFSLGPLLWGPMSEMYGRRLPYLISWPLFMITLAPSAWVDNIIVIIFFRFLSGCCAACALNNGGGIMSDMYNIVDMQAQAKAIAWYSLCVSVGPCVAPTLGFFISARTGPQLWALRVQFFFVVALWPLVFLIPETHGPTILAARARKMRRDGQNPDARAAHELQGRTVRQIIASHIMRPAGMMLREPIIQGTAIWTSVAYGIILFFFEVYPIVFHDQHGIQPQLVGLPFLSLIVGMTLAVVPYVRLVTLFQHLPIPKFIARDGHDASSPESKLKLSLFACLIMPISLFWFAWTSGSGTSWVAPTLAGLPFGFATIIIFFTFLTYASQTYTIFSSSAAACNTFARSFIACIFPIAAHAIVPALGTKWGVSLFGFLSLGLIPIPLVFLRYGAVLRARSVYAREANTIVAKMRAEAAAAAAKMEQEQGSTDSEKKLEVRSVLPEFALASPSSMEEGRVVAEEKIAELAHEQESAEEQKAPTEEEKAQAEEQRAPADEDGAPGEEKAAVEENAPVEGGKALVEEASAEVQAPAEAQTPAEEGQAPAEEEHAPAEEKAQDATSELTLTDGPSCTEGGGVTSDEKREGSEP